MSRPKEQVIHFANSFVSLVSLILLHTIVHWSGYYTALERTMFYGQPSEADLKVAATEYSDIPASCRAADLCLTSISSGSRY